MEYLCPTAKIQDFFIVGSRALAGSLAARYFSYVIGTYGITLLSSQLEG